MDKFFVKSEHGFETFSTLKEQSDYANELLEDYKTIGDEWPVEVEDICCGVITATARQVNLKIKPYFLDEGYDKDGVYWPGSVDQVCDYEMTEI